MKGRGLGGVVLGGMVLSTSPVIVPKIMPAISALVLVFLFVVQTVASSKVMSPKEIA